MRAAWLLSRSEVRRRWPSLLLLAVLIAITGGVTLTGVAGARRTSSSSDRFLEPSRNQDAIVFANDVRPADVARLRAMPGVEAIGYAAQLAIISPNRQFLGVGEVRDHFAAPRVLGGGRRPRRRDLSRHSSLAHRRRPRGAARRSRRGGH